MDTFSEKILNGGSLTETGDILKDSKRVYNQTRLRNLKRAKLRYKEAELQLQQKNHADEKTIHETMKEISQLKTEISRF